MKDEKVRKLLKEIMCFYDEELRWGRRKFDIGDECRLKGYVSQLNALKPKIDEGELKKIIRKKLTIEKGKKETVYLLMDYEMKNLAHTIALKKDVWLK